MSQCTDNFIGLGGAARFMEVKCLVLVTGGGGWKNPHTGGSENTEKAVL